MKFVGSNASTAYQMDIFHIVGKLEYDKLPQRRKESSPGILGDAGNDFFGENPVYQLEPGAAGWQAQTDILNYAPSGPCEFEIVV